MVEKEDSVTQEKDEECPANGIENKNNPQAPPKPSKWLYMLDTAFSITGIVVPHSTHRSLDQPLLSVSTWL